MSPNLYLYNRVSLIRASNILCIQMHTKYLTQCCPKVIPSGVKLSLLGHSLHPTRHCILFGPTLLQLAIMGPHNNQFTPNTVQYCTK